MTQKPQTAARKKRRQSQVLFALAMLICTAVPCAATLSYFPVWKQTVGNLHMAGGTLFMLCLAVILPLWRYISPRLRQPAPFVMWCVLFVAFYLIKDVIASLTVIAFWGAVSSGLSCVLFALSTYLKKQSEL